MPAAVTLPDFLEHLGMSKETTEALEVQVVLHAATEAAEGRVGFIVQRPVTVRAATQAGVLRLPHTPAVELVTVKGVLGASDLVVGDLDVDPDLGTVRTASGGWLTTGTYEVTYKAGRYPTTEEVPKSLQLAVMIIGKHLWETQRGRNLRPGVRNQPVTDGNLSGFALPNRAMQLLLPYASVWVG